MPGEKEPDSKTEAVESAVAAPGHRDNRPKGVLARYFHQSRVKTGKRMIRAALKATSADAANSEGDGYFGDVIQKRPADLREILLCLQSPKLFERKLAAMMFRAWMVDPDDVQLHRLALASASRSEAHRIERRSSSTASSQTPYEAAIAQSAARLSARHAYFYTRYYFRFGKAIEKAPIARRVEAEFHKRSTWLREALPMLGGLHRMQDIARETGNSWSPSLAKGYKFAADCKLRAEGIIFGKSFDAERDARGKKTIEDNLKNKSIAPCIWYAAWNMTALDGTPMLGVLSDRKINPASYLSEIAALFSRATYVWHTIALPEYRERCGPAAIDYPPSQFNAAELDAADEELVRSLMSVKAGRPRTR